MTTRKQYSAKFKARVALEAIRGGTDAEPVGFAVPGASRTDRALEENGDGAVIRTLCGRPETEGPRR